MIREYIDIDLLENNDGQIKGLPKNPRFIRDEKYKLLLKSIQELPEFMEARELLAVEHKGKYVVFAGNMRLKACRELNWDKVPTKIFDKDTSTEKLRAYLIKDNLAYGEPDWDILANEWDSDELEEWGVDLPTNWGNKLDDKYTQNIGEVVYEPKETNHKISDLFQSETKFDKEIEQIKNQELRDLFKARVSYFGNFNFAKIADYYAYQATPEEQRIFEKLALVLLDKDQLIENGFSKIIESIADEENLDEE